MIQNGHIGEIEYTQLWNNAWHHYRFCPIGERYAIRGINYRTVPVTKEYYILFNAEVNK